MRKLLMLIGALITCNAYGEEVVWLTATDGTIYAQNSCTTNGNITTPPIPQKTGFRFIGWEKAKTSDVVAFNPTSFSPTSNQKIVNTVGYGTWTATYSWGEKITGQGVCNNTSGTYNPPTISTTANMSYSAYQSGRYCWCRVTDFFGEDVTGSLPSAFISTYSIADNCANGCTRNCAAYFASSSSPDFRKKLLGAN